MYHVQFAKLSHCMLFSFFVCLLRGIVATTCWDNSKRWGQKPLKPKILSKIPRALMLSLGSFVVSVVLLSNSSPVNGVKFWLDFYVFANLFAARSLRSLCLIDTKPPFLQLIQCFILNLLPQGYFVGKFAMLHPYRKQITSQKCCFDSSKPKSLIGTTVSQFDTPFSMLTSSNLLDCSDRLFLNWSKLVWYQSCLSFFLTWLVLLIWILSTVYYLIRFLIRGASWDVRFLELIDSTAACSYKKSDCKSTKTSR